MLRRSQLCFTSAAMLTSPKQITDMTNWGNLRRDVTVDRSTLRLLRATQLPCPTRGGLGPCPSTQRPMMPTHRNGGVKTTAPPQRLFEEEARARRQLGDAAGQRLTAGSWMKSGQMKSRSRRWERCPQRKKRDAKSRTQNQLVKTSRMMKSS
jgi:hypothetical protein